MSRQPKRSATNEARIEQAAAKPTEETWRVARWGPEGHKLVIELVDYPYDPPIAQMDPMDDPSGHGYIDTGSQEARAHLAAAAPELYRALKDLTELPFCPSCSSALCADAPHLHGCLLDTALAKAERR